MVSHLHSTVIVEYFVLCIVNLVYSDQVNRNIIIIKSHYCGRRSLRDCGPVLYQTGENWWIVQSTRVRRPTSSIKHGPLLKHSRLPVFSWNDKPKTSLMFERKRTRKFCVSNLCKPAVTRRLAATPADRIGAEEGWVGEWGMLFSLSRSLSLSVSPPRGSEESLHCGVSSAGHKVII